MSSQTLLNMVRTLWLPRLFLFFFSFFVNYFFLVKSFFYYKILFFFLLLLIDVIDLLIHFPHSAPSSTAEKRKRQKVQFDASSVFLDAAENGELDVLKECIGKGVSPSHTTAEGVTGLHSAALGGHIEIIKYLLSKGVPINGEGFF